MHTSWSPEKKREYARERYYRLKANRKSTTQKEPPSSGANIRKKSRPILGLKSQSGPSNKEPIPDSTRIELTGNVFVDTGLAVIAARSKLDSIEDLTLGHLKRLHKNGIWLAKDSEPLKCITMIFTTNSLLKNPSIKDKDRRINMQASVTAELVNSIGNETQDEFCQSCGNSHSVDFNEVTSKALSKFEKDPQDRSIGRDWFPMAGSLGSDAQTLPGASQSPSLCAKCLVAVQYLPLGVRLFDRELAVFQSTSTEFWYELVRNISRQAQSRIQNGKPEIIGSKEGRGGLAKQLLDLFGELQREKKERSLTDDVELYVWRFSNSTSPNIEINVIPSFVLSFLHQASTKFGLADEIKQILSKEPTFNNGNFFSCVLGRKNYFGLYPGKLGKERDYKGASHDLFLLYQTHLLGRSVRGLRSARGIAEAVLEKFQKEQKTSSDLTLKTRKKRDSKGGERAFERLTRSEAFRDPKVWSLLRRIIADQAKQGKIDLDSYLDIFPYVGGRVAVSQSGRDMIRYYVGALARGKEVSFNQDMMQEHETIRKDDQRIYGLVNETASSIFRKCVDERGIDRFVRDVLAPLERGKLGARWLRVQFLKLARERPGFDYRTWMSLCHPDEKWTLGELYFQYRILWSNWIHDAPPEHYDNAELLPEVSFDTIIDSSELGRNIGKRIISIMYQYAQDRGWKRFEKDILDRLEKGTIGLDWFVAHIPDTQSGLTEQDLIKLTYDLEGNTQVSEISFKMSLLLNNAYRIAKNYPVLEPPVLKID